MRLGARSFTSILLLAATGLLALGARNADAQTLPAMKFVTAALISPTTAATHFGTATTHTNSLAGVNNFGGTPPEIVETARALKNNPDAIFDFVHNQIQTEYAFGERKGPLGALIDKSGTPFDQNVLFVNLVRQAGYAAQYQIGPVTMTGTAFASWTGGITDLIAACRMMASGGIPAVFTPAQTATCTNSGTVSSVTILHIWSQVNISGTLYAYDPSFKVYAGPTPTNLISASGLMSGFAATAAATGMNSGTSGNAPYIDNVGQASLSTYLTARGTQLLNWLKVNAPALDTDQVVGVTKIQATYAPSGGWRNATPPGYTTGSSVTVTGDMADQYRTKFQVAMTVAADTHNYISALNWTFFVDDIDGRRMGIATNFNNTGSASGLNINPATTLNNDGTQIPNQYTVGSDSLTVDDTVVQSWSCTINFSTCFGAQSPAQITLTATHPYAAGTFADETVVKQLTATAAPVAIVSGWGMISQARLTKWRDEVATDTPLPDNGVSPWVCDSGGDYCTESHQQSVGDLTRQKLAASWLAEMTRMMLLQATIGGAMAEHHHSIGIVDWRHSINAYVWPPPTPPSSGGPDYYGVADEFSDLNIDTVASITSKIDSAPAVAAISRSVALASATLEGSVLEQMEDLPDTASTASRFAWGNDPGADNQTGDMEDPCWTPNNPRLFFDFTGTSSPTRANLYEYEGYATSGPQGCHAAPAPYLGTQQPAVFSGAAESAIAAYLAAGFKVTASAETFLGPGARFGTCVGSVPNISCNPSVQRGDALVATKFSGSTVLQVAHVLTSVWGISKGGGGKQPEHFAQYDPSKAGDALKDRFVDRSVALGVDLKSGTAGYTTPSLISVGTGSAPYRLDYALTFKAAPTGCNTFGPCTGPIQGGWNQAWDVRFTNSGSGNEALGATSPFAAADTLAAFLVMQDIFAQTSLDNLNQDVFAALAADWWRQQMVANTATLSRGFSGQQYVRLADGTWMPPVGSPGVLTQAGARTKVRDPCHVYGGGWALSTSRRWDHSAVSFSLTNAGGDILAFAPWSWPYNAVDDDKCAIADGYQPVSWTWPQGVHLNFTYGTQIGGVTDYTAGVTGITSSLGRGMTFTSGVSIYGVDNGFTAAAGGITVGQQSDGAIADAVSAPTGGNTGAFWNYAFTPIQSRVQTSTAQQRPVPYVQLYQVFNPVSATAPALQYGYDTRGLVKTALDANGAQLPANAGLAPYAWFLALGGRGERDDPNGGAYSVYYDTDGNEVRNIDEIGREVDSLWDGRHRVTSRTFPESDQELFVYDANDNVLALTQAAKTGSGLANTVVTATYDPCWNHLASIKDAMGNETDFTYYPTSGPCPTTTGLGFSLMYQAQRPAVGGVRPTYTFQYNSIGVPTQSVDATGVTTTHGYDSFGNLTSTTEGAAPVGSNPALNLTTTFTPDPVGNVTTTTDPLNHVSNQTFDLDRRVLLAIAPDPGTGARPATNTIYDTNGRAIEVDKGTTNAAGTVFTSLETSTTAFDPNGNKTQETVLNGPFGSGALTVTQISYDALNRPICTAQRENPAVFSFLPGACAQSTGSAAGPDPITQLAYDLAGQKLSETWGMGTSLQAAYATYSYWPDGKEKSVTDAKNNTINLMYDGFNRLAAITHPDTTTETSQYDPDGDLTIWNNRGGFGIVRCYDVLNRKVSETGTTGASSANQTLACPTGGTSNLATRSWDMQPRTFTYDLAGRLTGASIPNFPLNYAYDAAGRPTARSGSWSAGYTWDGAGNMTALTYPDANIVDFQFDPLNRQTKAFYGSRTYASMTYDALGRRGVLTFTDNSTQTWGYDNADRVTSIAHVFPNDTVDNVTLTYGYDPAGRDTGVTYSNAAYAYVPTAATAAYATANALNQYPSVASYAYTYWPEGPLKENDTLQGNYDEMGKLMLAYITVAPGVIDPNNFEYMALDPLGHLYAHARQTTAGQTFPFTYHSTDGLRPETAFEWQCTQQLNVAPTCQGVRRYVLGPDPDERWAFIDLNGTIDSPHTDREGTIIALTNNAQVLQKYTYDAYAQSTAPLSEVGPGSNTYAYRFTGQRLDPNTGLYDYKARDYSTRLGRFLQPDPAGLDQGPNLYEYVGNDPVNKTDPTGMTCTGSGPTVQCTIDAVWTPNNRPLTQTEQKEVQNFNKAYTKAERNLLSHPNKSVTVKAPGAKAFQAKAGDVAHTLARRTFVADLRPGENPQGNSAETNGRATDVFSQGLKGNGATPAQRELDRMVTTVHEGIHGGPGESTVTHGLPIMTDPSHGPAYDNAAQQLLKPQQ